MIMTASTPVSTSRGPSTVFVRTVTYFLTVKTAVSVSEFTGENLG